VFCKSGTQRAAKFKLVSCQWILFHFILTVSVKRHYLLKETALVPLMA